MKNLLLVQLLFAVGIQSVSSQTLEDVFLNPPSEAKPIMIWQWMDGMISKEGITADLEAYQRAGIGGVQNFQVGGTAQGLVKDTTNAIGSERWQQLMRFAISECHRLGLSYVSRMVIECLSDCQTRICHAETGMDNGSVSG